MNAETKKELKAIADHLEELKVSLAADYKKLSDIVSDEENEVDGMENQDSDKAMARREEVETLRSAVDNLDEAIGSLETEVISALQE